MPDALLAFTGAALPLSEDDINAVAAELRLGAALVHAVRETEGGSSGFLPPQPKILFEAHAFWQQTKGHFGSSNVSSPVWDRALYGAGGAHQYERLQQAIRLCQKAGIDTAAALAAASWGAFQIMGSNYAGCGFSDVRAMVEVMKQSEKAHLEAFAAFCRHSGALDHLRNRDFAGFARIYNGPGQVDHYAATIAGAVHKWERALAAGKPPVPAIVSRASHPALEGLSAELAQPIALGDASAAVAALQRRLTQLGIVAAADGVFGPHTRDAVIALQRAHGDADNDNGRVEPRSATLALLLAS